MSRWLRKEYRIKNHLVPNTPGTEKSCVLSQFSRAIKTLRLHIYQMEPKPAKTKFFLFLQKRYFFFRKKRINDDSTQTGKKKCWETQQTSVSVKKSRLSDRHRNVDCLGNSYRFSPNFVFVLYRHTMPKAEHLDNRLN